jgi:hypothetical protein
MNDLQLQQATAYARRKPYLKDRPKKNPILAGVSISVLENIFFYIRFDKTFVPGQPVEITFDFFCFNVLGKYDFGTGYQLKVFLGDDLIASFPDSTTNNSYLPYQPSSTSLIDTGFNIFKLKPPDENSKLGNKLYKFGPKDIKALLFTNGRDAGPYEATDTLYIVPEEVNEGWWVWPQLNDFGVANTSLKSYQDAKWKTEYNVQGKFLNKSLYSTMHIDCYLNELLGTNSPVPIAYPSTDLAAHSPTDPPLEANMILSLPLMKDWNWITPFLWMPSQDTSRQYYYFPVFTLQDHYGNQYNPIQAAPLVVSVLVPYDKVSYGAAAFGLSVAAKALALASACLWFLGPIASGLEITAGVLGKLAMDPKKPNRKYLEKVIPRNVKPPKEFYSSAEATSFLPWAEKAYELIACRYALIEVEARWKGAKFYFNETGVRLQEETYRELVSRMEEVKPLLSSSINEALIWINQVSDISIKSVRLFIQQNKRQLKSNFRSQLKKLNYSRKEIDMIAELVRSEVADMGKTYGIGGFLNFANMHLINSVNQLKSLEALGRVESRR